MKRTELPNNIGGYQHIKVGPLEEGDIWVNCGAPQSFVAIDVFPTAEYAIEKMPPGWNVYRKMPTPGHLRDNGEKYDGRIKPEDTVQGKWSATRPEPDHAIDASQKPSNPKDIIGSDKIPLHLWPTTASALGSLALLDGALKYGRTNYRAVGVRASIYYDALNRHMNSWFEGQDTDADSGLPHLAHALACIAILVDSQAAGKLNDDRVISANYSEFAKSITPHVARLKEKHSGRNPKHYNISDSKPVASK
jgi:hypothetical protein